MILLPVSLHCSHYSSSQMADFIVEVILKRSKRFRVNDTDKLGSFLVYAIQLISNDQDGTCGMYLHPLSLLDIVA